MRQHDIANEVVVDPHPQDHRIAVHMRDHHIVYTPTESVKMVVPLLVGKADRPRLPDANDRTVER